MEAKIKELQFSENDCIIHSALVDGEERRFNSRDDSTFSLELFEVSGNQDIDVERIKMAQAKLAKVELNDSHVGILDGMIYATIYTLEPVVDPVGLFREIFHGFIDIEPVQAELR